MREEITLANELIDFIHNAPSRFHVVESIKEILKNKGFKELDIKEKWALKKEESYFTVKNNSAITAFRIGKGDIEKDGFRIIGAHTDSPTFRVKPAPEIVSEGRYLKLNTEVYGGPILNTWMDRPLSIAGRISLRAINPFSPGIKFVNIKKPVLVIPNLAIHMNRKINEGFELNRQKDTLPLLAMINDSLEKEDFLLKIIGEAAGVDVKEIVDFDLFLYEYEKGSIVGARDEFISCGRLDDLSMVHAGIKALANTSPGGQVNMMVCFDNEEVGSNTEQGADSPMLRTILERIVLSLGGEREDFFRALYNSFMISADNAHALHPNVPEKSDPVNRPFINGGPAVKISANQYYTTDSLSLATYEQLCHNAGVPIQKFLNRSDERGGSTIGPLSASHIDIASVDMGSPILAMHSIRELGGVMDHFYALKSFEEFYRYK